MIVQVFPGINCWLSRLRMPEDRNRNWYFALFHDSKRSFYYGPLQAVGTTKPLFKCKSYREMMSILKTDMNMDLIKLYNDNKIENVENRYTEGSVFFKARGYVPVVQ